MFEAEKENFLETVDFEAKQNIVGFFDLLLKIDKRNNPLIYQSNEEYDNNGNTNIADKAE